MSAAENNCLFGIDKYSGSFDQDELGVTLIPTETIKLLNNFTLLALFTFLSSCSSNWKLNPKHLANHFNCNKDKIYSALDSLIQLKLLTRTKIREKGKFVKFHYRLHLRQKEQVLPFPEKPDTVKPDTVIPDTYKTNIPPLQNKEGITTTTEKPINPVVVSINSKELSGYEQIKLTEAFEKNPFESEGIKNIANFLSAALFSILSRESHITRQQRLHGIIKLVNQGRFEEPPLWAKEYKKLETCNETDEQRRERQFFQYELEKERTWDNYTSKHLEKYPQMRSKYSQ